MSMKPSTKFMKLIAPGIGISGPRLGPIWVYCENVLNLKKSFSQLPHQGEIKLNVWLNVHEAPSAGLFAPKDCSH